MAVESKHGSNGQNGASANGAPTRPSAKRISSLMKQGSSLPTVESSLDEFIAKANQTLVDVTSWEQQAKQAREEDAARREQDAQRWKAAESQLRDSEVREASLRRQLDGLQGKLAEAEARVAIAMSSAASGSMAAQQTSAQSEAAIRELRSQIEDATARMRASEARSAELAAALTAAKSEVAARPALSIDSPDHGNADDRIRLAEAKAAKALAAARAAAAGLTVSSADLAAIESGLIVAVPARRRSPWPAVALAFVGGLAIMAVVWKLVLDQPSTPQAAAPSVAQPVVQPVAQPAPTPAPTSAPAVAPAPAPVAQAKAPEVPKPTATPIEEATPQPTVTPIEEAKPEPAKAEKPRVVAKRPAHTAAPKKAATLADPFAEPAKKPEKKDDKPKGNIVDPF